jgi:D-inositol-3-phosphate glycosyltransferase
VILCLGRLTAAMKADLGPLLLAFAKLVAPSMPAAHLVLAGDDTRHEAEKLRACCQELGCADRVTVLANVTWDAKMRLYAAADVFVAPSDNIQETFGLAVVEAMSCGIPVVTTDWDGFRKTVQHDVTGIRVPTQWAAATDEISRSAFLRTEPINHAFFAQTVIVDLAALAEALSGLLANPDLRRRMGEAGRARVLREYDRPRVVAQYEELWEGMWREPSAAEVGPVAEEFAYIDRYQIFSEYPTQSIDPHARAGVTPLGEDYANLLPVLRRSWERVPLFDERLCTAIVEACERGVMRQIGDVLEITETRTGESRTEIFRHLVHLAKQGMLRLEPVGPGIAVDDAGDRERDEREFSIASGPTGG